MDAPTSNKTATRTEELLAQARGRLAPLSTCREPKFENKERQLLGIKCNLGNLFGKIMLHGDLSFTKARLPTSLLPYSLTLRGKAYRIPRGLPTLNFYFAIHFLYSSDKL